MLGACGCDCLVECCDAFLILNLPVSFLDLVDSDLFSWPVFSSCLLVRLSGRLLCFFLSFNLLVCFVGFWLHVCLPCLLSALSLCLSVFSLFVRLSAQWLDVVCLLVSLPGKCL